MLGKDLVQGIAVGGKGIAVGGKGMSWSFGHELLTIASQLHSDTLAEGLRMNGNTDS